MRRSITAGLALICLSSFAPIAGGQITTVNNSTATPVPGSDRDYIKMLNEQVDPASGSVSLRVQVPVPKGRGPTLPFSFAYDSGSAVYPSASPANGQGMWITSVFDPYLMTGGWSYTVPQRTYNDFTKIYVVEPKENLECNYISGFVFQDPTGARHSLSLGSSSGNYTNCETGAQTTSEAMYSANLVKGYPLVADADGTIYSFPLGSSLTPAIPSFIEDRNGNTITLDDLSVPGGVQGAFTVTDTLGRLVLSSSGFGVTGNTVTVAGLANPYEVTWGTATTNFSVTSTGTLPGVCVALPKASTSSPVISAIELPNGQKYQFTYDPSYGSLSKITYPSGGYISYGWGLNTQAAIVEFPSFTSSGPGAPCYLTYDKPAIMHRYVSFDGSTVALQQDFSYSTTWSSNPTLSGWTSKQTTVTTHDLVRGTSFQTIYTYSGTPAPEPLFFNLAPVNDDAEIPQEATVVYKDTNGAVLKTVTKTWHDLFVIQSEQTTLGASGGLTSKVTYTYGSGDQLTEKDEYDFGSGAPGPLLRKTVTNYQAFADTPIYASGPSIFDKPCQTIVYDGTGTNRVAETDYLYDGGTAVCGTAGTPSVSSVSGLPSGTHDETNYSPTSSASRANLTTATSLCLQGAPACTSGNPATTYAYDETGQALSMRDPRGNSTQYSYADSYTIGTPPGNTNAFLTKITRPMTNGVNHISNYSYGYPDGRLTVAKDENGQSTSYAYADPLDRLTLVTYPPGAGETIYTYNDAPSTPSVTTQREISAGSFVTTVDVMDGMGHPTQFQLTTDQGGIDYTVTAYDGLGRAMSVTNPYRTTSDPTYGVTTYAYDALNRVSVVTNPDSSTIQTAYTGRAAEVTDEGNGTRHVQRISQSDGLGRLTSVCEVSSVSLSFGTSKVPVACGQDISATGFPTSYQYDALGNLLSVSQGGLNPRAFVYDSLSRLTSSTNPESGTSTYTYDANSNLTSKTAPKPNQTSSSVTVATTNQYDSLNRITSKSYNDGATPTANFVYDKCPTTGCPGGYPSTPNSVGRLVEAYVSNAGTFRSYDSTGHTLEEWQCTPQNCGSNYFPLVYTYDLFGDILSSSNGAGVTLSYTYNTAPHLNGISSSLVDSNHPRILLTGVTYNAPGELTSLEFDHINESRTHDNRLRLTSLNDLGIYTFALTYAPNGDVLSANDSVNGTWNYGTNSTGLNGYDDFNRLLLATSGTSTYSYLYDRVGNRWEQLLNGSCAAGTASCLTFDANNHESNGLLSYDAAGNVTSDNMHYYAYDAENRLVSVDSGTTASYIYDANRRRVRKTTGGTSVDYLYDLAGQQVTELSSTGGWNRGEVYAGTRHIATYSGGTSGTTYYVLADWLGTERVRAIASTGALSETCTSLPFGDNLQCSASDPSPMHFTGKERDSESGLDNFGARYDSSQYGRFMSPDPLGGKLADPQTLNKYSYVRNNPVTLTDPTGLYTINCTDDVKNCNKQEQNFDKALQNASKSKDASVRDAAAAYGPLSKQAGDAGDNGVNVSLTKTVDAQHPDVTGQTTSQPGTGGLTYNAATNTFQQATQVTIKAGLGSDTLEETAVHEGVHVEDRAAFVNSLGLDLKTGAITMNNSLNITARQSEINAYGVENIFLQSMGLPQRNVQDILLHPPYSDNPNINKPLFQALPGGPPR